MPTRRVFLKQAAVSGVAAALLQDVQAEGSATNKKATSAPAVPMNTYKIPQTDLVVSRIAYGAAMLSTAHSQADFIEKTVRAMRAAYDNGITLFDLADIYGAGQSESSLGDLLRQRSGLRDRIVIQSKCGLRLRRGWVPGDPVGVDLSHDHIVSAVEGSLKRLGTDYLDILLLHVPDPLLEPEHVAQAFDRLKDAGKVRFFGVSNYSAVQIELLRKFVRQPLVVNQMRLSLAHYSAIADRSSFGGIVDYCHLHELQVQAFSPLKGGDVYGRPLLLDPPEDAAPEVKRMAQVLASVAKTHNATPAAVMLAWLLRHPAGILPIIGASKPEHVIENCAADRIKLSRDEWTSLFAAAATIQDKAS